MVDLVDPQVRESRESAVALLLALELTQMKKYQL